MRRLILAASLIPTLAFAQPAPAPHLTEDYIRSFMTTIDCPKFDCTIAIGPGALLNLTTGVGNVAVGRCAGASVRTESHVILLGDYTSVPMLADGFVNINNHFCYLGEAAATCPAPEPECLPDHPPSP